VGHWSARETLYDGMGHRKSISEWGNTAKKTQFLNYDAFGRPVTITPPDGSSHNVTMAYTGDRVITRNVKVGTTWTGTAVTETPSAPPSATIDRAASTSSSSPRGPEAPTPPRPTPTTSETGSRPSPCRASPAPSTTTTGAS